MVTQRDNLDREEITSGPSRKGMVWLVLSFLVIAGIIFAWPKGQNNGYPDNGVAQQGTRADNMGYGDSTNSNTGNTGTSPGLAGNREVSK